MEQFYTYEITGKDAQGKEYYYYGMSGDTPENRIKIHKSEYRRSLKNNKVSCCSSFEIFKLYENWEDNEWEFNIIEWFNTKQEAIISEGEWIDNCECVNKKRSLGIQSETITEYKRIWAEQYRRKIGIKQKVIGFDNALYQRNWMREFRASKSEIEHQAELETRRQKSAARPQSVKKSDAKKQYSARKNKMTEDEHTELLLKKNEAWANRTPEQILIETKKRADNYQKKKEAISIKNKEKYANMTAEEKTALAKKQTDRLK